MGRLTSKRIGSRRQILCGGQICLLAQTCRQPAADLDLCFHGSIIGRLNLNAREQCRCLCRFVARVTDGGILQAVVEGGVFRVEVRVAEAKVGLVEEVFLGA